MYLIIIVGVETHEVYLYEEEKLISRCVMKEYLSTQRKAIYSPYGYHFHLLYDNM